MQASLLRSLSLTPLRAAALASLILLGCAMEEDSSAPAPVTRAAPLSSAPKLAASKSAHEVASPRLPAALEGIKTSERVRIDAQLAQPSFLTLARPAGARVRTVRADLPGAPGLESRRQVIEQAARALLVQQRELYDLSEQDIARATLKRVHDTGRGGVSATFVQAHHDLDVHGAQVSVMMTPALEGVAISGNLHPATLSPPLATHTPRGEAQALRTALAAFGVELEVSKLDVMSAHAGFERFALAQQDEALTFRSPARVKPIFHRAGRDLVPAYFVELDALVDGEALAQRVVLAAHGEHIFEAASLIAHDAYTYRVWADDEEVPYSNPFGAQLKPYLTGFFPLDYEPTRLVTLESQNMRGDAWLPPASTETIGNNLAVYADISGRDGFDASDVIADITQPGVFDWTYDFSQQPGSSDEQLKAPIVQMFYTLNHMHDLFYEHGFDEQAGNAQQDNYGRGGSASDRILAESLDSSGTNNANMFTPSDGASPRMQMYRFTYSSVDRVTVLAPAEITGDFSAGLPGYPESFDLSGPLVRIEDGTAPVRDGCEPLLNAGELAGKIALVDRGLCGFVDKIRLAEAAGAAGVVIINNDTQNPDRVFDMGGIDQSIRIPSMMISSNLGQSILQQLAGQQEVRMRLLALPHQDASLDGDIVTHEWGHYLFGRLTQGGGSTQNGGINEGNSDFVALLFSVREQDTLVTGNDAYQGAYAMGQYAGHRYWTGTRRVAYSTDMDVNPLTFKHISDRQPLPPAVPGGVANSEVHNSGEVWSTMMWECYAAMLNEHGFEDGRARMLGYLVAGLKMFPRDATFIEARDAMLAAMRASDEDDFRTCFFTFAKRGMGVGARAPGRFAAGNLGVVESFGIGGALELSYLELEEEQGCDDDGYLDVGETAEISVDVLNSGAESLSGVTVRLEVVSNGNQNIPRRGVSFPEGDTETLPDLEPFGFTRVTIPVKLDNALGSDLFSYRVIAEHPDAISTAVLDAGVLVNTDVEVDSSTREDVEFGRGSWETDRDSTLAASQTWTISTQDGNGYWFGPEEAYKTDLRLVTPKLNVSSTEDLTLSFSTRHDFEVGQYAWDGGVIEYTINDGATWSDIEQLGGVDAGYTGTLANGAELFNSDPADNNPLVDRRAYVGTNPGFPDFDRVTVKFGRTLAGKTVKLRFRVGTDEGTSGGGWGVDAIAFEGIENTPFPALIDETSLCGAGPAPQARAGIDRTVEEKTQVVLDASASINPAGGGLTYSWVRLSGPAIEITGADTSSASFIAPDVSEPTEVNVQLTISDGAQESFDDVTFTVVPVNEAPVAKIQVKGEPAAGETITLDGSESTDADGDALTYAWAQTSGPGVALRDATGASPSFVVPELTEDATLTFQLLVTDGKLLSAPATASVQVSAAAAMEEELEEDKKGASSGSDEGCASAPAGQPASPLAALLLGVMGLLRLVRRRS